MKSAAVLLPRHWKKQVKSSVIAALGLARFTLMQVRGWCADSALKRVQLAGERDAALARAAHFEEEARILRARMERIQPQRRPQYPPPERMAILTLRAATGWSAAETARRFQITEATVASWMSRLDEDGPDALVELRRPINGYSDGVTALIHELREKCPAFGKRRSADVLMRGGLHVGPTTIQRHRKKSRPTETTPPETQGGSSETIPAERVPGPPAPAPRRVTAKAPHHVWHSDLTLLPTMSGWWVPWIPQALAQLWPFCFWLGVVLDHYTRTVVAWQIYRKQPDAKQVVALLDSAVRKAGQAPKHIITDCGAQFQDEYLAWCKRRRVKPRRGAVGKHGSIAIIERFWRSMKDEMLGRLSLVPLRTRAMAAEITAYLDWYHHHRPHQGLAGLTPAERAGERRPARLRKRIEPRPHAPLARGDPSQVVVRVRDIRLRITPLTGRAHLPVVELRSAA